MKILYLTDLYYEAKGRKYFEEDLYITRILKEHFDIALCNPKNSKDFENDVDLIVFRNTGPVSGFEEEYESFVKRVTSNNINTFNEFVGKADMKGKQYLLDLTLDDYPVIPTIDDLENLNLLPDCERYVVKPKDGADSIGLEFLTKNELFEKDLGNMLIQPAIDFEYEVSFYFINDRTRDGNLKTMNSVKPIRSLQKNSLIGIVLKTESKGWMSAEQKRVNYYWWNLRI